MKYFYIFCLHFLTKAHFFGQSLNNTNEADNLFANHGFGHARYYYQELLRKDSTNAEVNFKMGVCYLNSRSQKQKAIQCFRKVLTQKDQSASLSPITYKLLADACYQVGSYDQAISNYETYLETVLKAKNRSQFAIDDVNQKIEMCRMARELKNIKRLIADVVEKKYTAGELSASLTNYLDSTSSLRNAIPDNDLFENNYFQSGTIPDRKILDTSSCLREATMATSTDGQIVLLYRDDKGEGNVYSSRLDGNDWTLPQKCERIINQKGWEADEFISADGNSLYFTSSRPGGYGGKDIYKSNKLPDGEWGKAINLGPPVNSPYNDEAPVIHPDGVTLLFSSDRYKAEGFFDIFSCTLTDSGTWSKEKNIGYPIKKMRSPVQVKKRKKNEDEKTTQNNNYVVTFHDANRKTVTFVKGNVSDKKGHTPSYVEISVISNETGKLCGVYHADAIGEFSFMLPVTNDHNILFKAEGYIPHSINIRTAKDTTHFEIIPPIELVPIASEAQDLLNNIFFEKGKPVLSPGSYPEIEHLFSFLSQNPTVKIELNARISSKDNTPELTRLFKDRLQLITTELVEKGIDKERLETRIYQAKIKKHATGESFEENEAHKPRIKVLSIR